MMKAKIMGSVLFPKLEARYNELNSTYTKQQNMKVKPDSSQNKNRNLTFVDENDLTISQMVEVEKESTSKDNLRQSAKQIASMKTFDNNDLDQQDEVASKLAKLSETSEIAINKFIEDPKLMKTLESCLFCQGNGMRDLPILKETDNFYITLPPKPEITSNGTLIVPKKHIKNSLYLDSNEYEELKDIMESLSIFYFKSHKQNVIFYEESLYETNHANIKCVPIPASFEPKTVGSYFREGIMEQVIDNEHHHQALIKTSDKGYRQSLAKEAPFFHVWLDVDGGLGHIVEDVVSWPKHDSFSRRIIGGFLDADQFKIMSRPKFSVEKRSVIQSFVEKLKDM
ncbi:unnamed protein product [Ambrosiozyma monospora]|uniref:Unnamed protein product n=1 Tax=Ambrosiozyma monospora TaxID=43982 RepID=A0ACB5TAS2_AMBMO|nr:unnamed protein product [Ambrosiozyma monospora]